MKARTRYCILSAALLLILSFAYELIYFYLHKTASNKSKVVLVQSETNDLDFDFKFDVSKLPSYLDQSSNSIENQTNENEYEPKDIWEQISLSNIPNTNFNNRRKTKFAANCRLWNCFDFSLCAPNSRLRVHIYPPISENSTDVSDQFRLVLQAIQQSPFYEPDASRACVFVPSIDLLDRDPLSNDFRPHLPKSFIRHEGRNHLLFNLYSGSWPSYDELDFAGFDPGYAMLVKASFSVRHFRAEFDISYPLYGRSHPFYETLKSNTPTASDSSSSSSINSFRNKSPTNLNVDSNKDSTSWSDLKILYQQNLTKATENRHLLVFKGTRYVNGQGSDVRDALPLLHNGIDVHILTTCRKSKSPADQRCVVSNEDDQLYASTDYEQLMKNSTFCLVPRGRRLGSFRFLEALKFNCIPVLLSDEWLLPFHDVLDWQQAVLRPDQRTLLRFPDMLRSIGWLRIQRMRAIGSRLYHTYFASVQQTVLTVLHILEQRIYSNLATRAFVWSGRMPLSSLLAFNALDQICERDFPIFRAQKPLDCDPLQSHSLDSKFTALVYVSQPLAPRILLRLLRSLSKVQHLYQTVVIWSLAVDPPSSLVSDRKSFKSILVRSTNRFPMQYVHTDCVLTLDADSSLLPEELDFGFRVWRSLPNRLHGFSARAHVYDESRSRFAYSSRWANDFSIILLDAAFFHKWYAIAFTRHLDLLASKSQPTLDSIQSFAFTNGVCIDLHFNFLFALFTRQSPIKLTQRKRTTGSPAPLPIVSGSEAFGASQRCFQMLANRTFGRIPLRTSQARFDPLLFKDPVSALRKRYRRIELVL